MRYDATGGDNLVSCERTQEILSLTVEYVSHDTILCHMVRHLVAQIYSLVHVITDMNRLSKHSLMNNLISLVDHCPAVSCSYTIVDN